MPSKIPLLGEGKTFLRAELGRKQNNDSISWGKEKEKKEADICLKERPETRYLIIPCSKLSETGSSGREGGKADLGEFEHNLLQPYLKCLLCGKGSFWGSLARALYCAYLIRSNGQG